MVRTMQKYNMHSNMCSQYIVKTMQKYMLKFCALVIAQIIRS